MINLGGQLGWIERWLKNWWSTLLGVSVRAFPEAMNGMWSSDWAGKGPECWQHQSIGWKLKLTKWKKEGSKYVCTRSILLSVCAFCCWHCLSSSDSRFFSFSVRTHPSVPPGNFQAFSVGTALHDWSLLFWGSSFFDWTTGFPGSPAKQWSFWDC